MKATPGPIERTPRTAGETPVEGTLTPRRRIGRGSLAAGAALVGGAVLVIGCAGGAVAAQHGTPAAARTSAQASAQSSAQASAQARKASGARITITPGDRAFGVGIAPGAARVTVTGGKLTRVAMVDRSTGAQVPGHLSADGRGWVPDAPLSHSTRYAISASAANAKGGPAVSHASFTTTSPAGEFVGRYTPQGGGTVGVGMLVSIDFDKSITHRADVESHITVGSSSGQRVVGHWFGDRRLDFRPARYWKPGSKVTVRLGLRKVAGANGVTGVQDKTVAFHVGRSQISTVNAATQTMKVVENGRKIRTIPVSTGSAGHATYNGRMVITQKYKKIRMDGSTVGFDNQYDIPDVPHAMRLSQSGTFIHGNYWSPPSVFGARPASHGCIGLMDVQHGDDAHTNASWFFRHSLTGDVVVVKNSKGRTVAPDNGLGGWNMPWSRWVAGSTTR